MYNAKEPLVSVIIPTYRRSDTLLRAINSVYSQTYNNIEIIVVDDNASFPEVRKQNERSLLDYPNIIFVKNKINLGGGLSRNVGIRISKGKYVAFLDDDDEYLPNKIEEQMKLMLEKVNDNVAVVYCYADMINVNGSVYSYINDIQGVPLLENIENCLAPTSFWLCDKEKLLSVGGFEDISSRQDASLLMKLFIKGYSAFRVPKTLLKYYWHDSNNGISGASLKSINAENQYRNTFLKLAKEQKTDSNTIDRAKFLFAFRVARECVTIGEKNMAFIELKEMSKINLFDKKIFKIFFGILFNNTYRFLSKIKNKKRVGI